MKDRPYGKVGKRAKALWIVIVLVALATIGFSVYLLTDRAPAPQRGTAALPSQAQERQQRQGVP